jgi:SagB-type dehydrogenase family enzyme
VNSQRWRDLQLDSESEDQVWELFHENSKTSPFDPPLSEQAIQQGMNARWESLPYDNLPVVDLPAERTPLTMSLEHAIRARCSARVLSPGSLPLESVATLLHSAYGVTRDQRDAGFPRPFRTVPSAGSLYPLDIYLANSRVDDLPAGLYHYNPTRNHLRFLQSGDLTERISEALVQKQLAQDALAIFFLTAQFDRCTFKYGERGYRFVMLEAGHVAQNLNLAATGLGLGCLNIGGYYDRTIDDLLDLDGVTHSTVYMVAVGGRQ